ncbi:MAG: GrpB family protein [Gaiellaceae bacterium]
MPDPIVIVDYDPAWPLQFERVRERAAAAVGDLAVAIEHVGSTAVVGLAAKPVIDLVIVVEPGDEQDAVERLTASGYVHRGNLGVEGREAFDVPEGAPRHHHHLYVSPTDSEELRAQLAFRDRLRESRELAIEYEALKHELAARFRDDRMGYTDAKTDFVAASRPVEAVDAAEQESKSIASPAEQPESRGGEMHVRVARFEGIDVASIDRDMEQFGRMVRSEERRGPSGCPRRRSRLCGTACGA